MSAILNADGDSIQIDIDPPCALGETEEELKAAVQGLIDELSASLADVGNSVVEAISKAVPAALEDVAEVIGNHLSKQSLDHALELEKAHAERAETVQHLWGTTIDQLELLRHLVLEWSFAALELRQGCYVHPNIAFALKKLAQRAYEISGELTTLTRAGYADGALARWRSLHEICVVAMFLSRRSDRCSEMYLSHHWIEELRLLDVDKASGTARTNNTHRDRYESNLRLQKTSSSRSLELPLPVTTAGHP